MNTRRLGTSDLAITPLGFGAWAAGGDWKFGWGAQDDNASIAAILRALEHGINWIDTAAIYGLGHSEEVVARALAQWTGPRPYVFTKCGMLWNEAGEVSYSTRAASIRREVEDSLRRLRVDVIDLYQMHWPADDLGETEEGWAEMAKLQAAGKVRYLGASNFTVAELEKVRAIAPVTALQPPYSLINREAEAELLPFCTRSGIGVINYSPMGSGLLTGAMTRERIATLPAGDWRARHPNFQEPKLSAHLRIAARLAAIGARHGVSAGVVAIAWTLHHAAVTGTIVGARSPAQVDGIVGALTFRLSPDEIEEIAHA